MATTITTTTAATPTVLLVPGYWEGPAAFQPLSDALSRVGIRVSTASLRSSGHADPPAPGGATGAAGTEVGQRRWTLADDTAGVREAIQRAVDEDAGEAGVVLFLHSVGGVIGSNAMEGLDFAAWAEKSKSGSSAGGGGVRKIIFCAAGVAPEGFDQFGGPFVVEHDDENGTYCTCRDAKELLFHDLPPDQADRWHKELRVQPTVRHWASSGPVAHCGWRNVPSTYILCEQDRLIPTELQEALAEMAGCGKVVRLQAGHCPFLSMTDDVARVIAEEVEGL
ncbi:Alpha/beta hydrolase fold-1 [Microdochium trichocladiopsis]|uniref:Alpha/beta hydrolase fold-1 n=1 Tax=Microdochium trichocladiopsis TaxID=1682393 RepID=A0A9P8Y7D8_9PEZI|nr:Alpha/beta hydrolase fold-1 [Microdochium trichocladiopsis]KAH7031644.1 Alpha/beta hydrolase fold-1 [Microdochium trichocladiopsis]